MRIWVAGDRPNNHLVNLIPQHPKIAGDYETPLPLQPRKKKITHITKNRKNKNFAIPADAAAIPPNPSTAAMSAIIRNVTAQPNIVSPRYKRIALIAAVLGFGGIAAASAGIAKILFFLFLVMCIIFFIFGWRGRRVP